ncbi:MAG: organic hydroperoxide resistance protein [Firmicutes bacterium]|uniref:Peroxiredoxin, Ohr subfamily n=1 Tax=Melghirimyces thermohalophilus TaxID=1236220 RepID=A0A1G6HKR9_9BACL|nr:organic hydroperoxide resistance protein [Melghirimyces thermohalophilus]MDA8354380.1 organic hydroperoxide resistance protein [Bacillota bacterium]SDB94839.1 peroxiredoxin, Ohr subfamily [Melghirimyces thermohalophilus]
MKPLYTAEATTTGGRDGYVRTSDNQLDLKVSTPKEMGGSGGDATNPEQLFAAGYSACFGSALSLVMQKKNIQADGEPKVTAAVTIGEDASDGGFALAVTLTVDIPGVDEEQSRKLAEEAHQVCPYSKATRDNIEVQLKAKA